jgi:hypothetical protein
MILHQHQQPKDQLPWRRHLNNTSVEPDQLPLEAFFLVLKTSMSPIFLAFE